MLEQRIKEEEYGTSSDDSELNDSEVEETMELLEPGQKTPPSNGTDDFTTLIANDEEQNELVSGHGLNSLSINEGRMMLPIMNHME